MRKFYVLATYPSHPDRTALLGELNGSDGLDDLASGYAELRRLVVETCGKQSIDTATTSPFHTITLTSGVILRISALPAEPLMTWLKRAGDHAQD